jgi:hypothetical protein
MLQVQHPSMSHFDFIAAMREKRKRKRRTKQGAMDADPSILEFSMRKRRD